MAIVTPPIVTPPNSTSSTARRFLTTENVIVVCAIAVVVIILAFTSIAEIALGVIAFGVIAPVGGLAMGFFSGFSVGFSSIALVGTGLLLTPPLMAGILGALAGALAAWLQRTLVIKNELGHSFVSSLFSPEIFGENAWGFVCQLIVSTLVGYAVAAGFASIGMLGASTPDLATIAGVVLGGGSPPADSISWISTLFALLAALLVAGGIIGGCAGGIVGGVIGAGLSSIGVATVIQSATEGAVFRFFADFRPADIKSGRFMYLLIGATAGIGEGVIVGAGTGVVLFLARLAEIIN